MYANCSVCKMERVALQNKNIKIIIGCFVICSLFPQKSTGKDRVCSTGISKRLSHKQSQARANHTCLSLFFGGYEKFGDFCGACEQLKQINYPTKVETKGYSTIAQQKKTLPLGRVYAKKGAVSTG